MLESTDKPDTETCMSHSQDHRQTQNLCLGLLETDVLYPDLIDDFVSYGSMFRKLFMQRCPQLTFRHYQVTEGVLPEQADECDVYLITGSKAGVYDPLPWLPMLRDWIQQAYPQGIPMLGICFGHQMLAHSLGGHAEKSSKGWGVGNQTMQVEHLPDYVEDQVASYRLIYSHQDQVMTLPSDATRLAGNGFCPNASWFIGNQVLSFQGHPEFDAEYFRRLIQRRASHIGEERLQQALDQIEQGNDSDRVIDWLLAFILQAQR